MMYSNYCVQYPISTHLFFVFLMQGSVLPFLSLSFSPLFSENEEHVRSAAQSSSETQRSAFTLERPQHPVTRGTPGEDEPLSLGWLEWTPPYEPALVLVKNCLFFN